MLIEAHLLLEGAYLFPPGTLPIASSVSRSIPQGPRYFGLYPYRLPDQRRCGYTEFAEFATLICPTQKIHEIFTLVVRSCNVEHARPLFSRGVKFLGMASKCSKSKT
jgi:hypothetical protein